MKKKLQTKFKCTEKISYLYNRVDLAQKLFDKEASKTFFRNESYLEKLLDRLAEYRSHLWHEIYKVYPSIQDSGTWGCNETEIWQTP